MSDGLRAHDTPLCAWCGRVLRALNGARVYCSARCQSRASYHRRHPEASRFRPPEARERNQGPRRTEWEDPAWIEAQLARWAAYHKAAKTYRITDGWLGGHSSLLRREP